jgi:ABC-type polysaccharide/polyol phosphate export permease
VATVEVTSSSLLYEPVSLPRKAAREIRSVVRYRELLRYLVKTRLRVHTNNTFFGLVWWILDPLILMLIYTVFVHLILRRGGPHFPIFVFSGILFWKFFSNTVQGSMQQTLGKETVMKQVPFPRTVLPLSSMFAETVNIAFGLCILIPFTFYPYGIEPAPIDVLALLVLFILSVFALGLGYLFSALYIFIRDLERFVNYFFRLLFFMTPILFSFAHAPPNLRRVLEMSPIAKLLSNYRGILLDHQLPNFEMLGFLFIISLATLVAGYFVFVRLQDSFNKVL